MGFLVWYLCLILWSTHSLFCSCSSVWIIIQFPFFENWEKTCCHQNNFVAFKKKITQFCYSLNEGHNPNTINEWFFSWIKLSFDIQHQKKSFSVCRIEKKKCSECKKHWKSIFGKDVRDENVIENTNQKKILFEILFCVYTSITAIILMSRLILFAFQHKNV